MLLCKSLLSVWSVEQFLQAMRMGTAPKAAIAAPEFCMILCMSEDVGWDGRAVTLKPDMFAFDQSVITRMV